MMKPDMNLVKDLAEACRFALPLSVVKCPEGVSPEYWAGVWNGIWEALRAMGELTYKDGE
jgi:hypothetical protein